MSKRLFTMVPLLALLSACEDPGATDPVRGDTVIDTSTLDDVLDLDPQLYAYDLTPPAPVRMAAAAADNTPASNPITDAGATLGRVLFWDTELSANGTVACASCHAPDAGLADDLRFSEGFDGGLTGRKSMPLANLRYYRSGRMFWDERAETLEEQVLLPIQNEVEMGLTLDELVDRVSASDHYATLFEAAFGDPEVTPERISRALAQLVRSMTTFDSAWDAGIAATGDPLAPFPGFTDEENRGKEIFFGQHEGRALCNACHFSGAGAPGAPGGPGPGGAGPGGAPGPGVGLFFMPGPRVNGLGDPEDAGIFDVTGDPADRGRFKSPNLRNAALRGPLMHDGRFATLAEVVDFYDHGIQDVPNLDPILRGPDGPRRLNLSPADRAALVAFLETLTDEGPSTDPRFADPFVR